MTTATFSSVIRGVALGDAWGDKNEFKRLEVLTKDDLRGPGIPALLDITDDTQMTLFLADALDLSRDGDMEDVQDAIQEAFLAYYKDPDTGSRAPGTTVMGSLGSLSHSGDWTKSTNDHSDGSGTVMRTSATAFLPEDRWVGVTAFAAAVTHGAANAIAAAILDAAILREIVAGEVKPGELVQRALEMANDPELYGLLDVGTWLEDYKIPGGLLDGFDELARLLTMAIGKLDEFTASPWAIDSEPSNKLIGSGYSGGGWRAHETLVIALMDVDMFVGQPMEALRRAVTSQGDSDTIGAVAGALLGAAYPEDAMKWWASYGKRFEARYIRWIENEADDYLFTPTEVPVEVPTQESLWQRVSRLFA